MGNGAKVSKRDGKREHENEEPKYLPGLTPGPKPLPASTAQAPKPAAAMGEAVAIIEALVQGVRSASTIERKPVTSDAATRIAGHLRYVEAVFGHYNLQDEPSLAVEFRRLEMSMVELFRIGRLSHLHMREVHLEKVFDLEDTLRMKAGLDRASRAENYYDDTRPRTKEPVLLAKDPMQAGSEARQATDHLSGKSDAKDKPPETRDEFVDQILAKGSAVGKAMESGSYAAESIIKEPTAAQNPEFLEVLLKAALGFVFSGLDAGLGKIIAGGFKRLDKLVGIERTLYEHVGADLKKITIDSVKATALDIIKAPFSMSKHGNDAANNGHLTPRTIFLINAQTLTSQATTRVETRFLSYKSALKRLPIDILIAVHAAFTKELLAEIQSEFTNRLIVEWVNFVKAAAERGVMNNADGKLSNLDPSGVLQIELGIERGPRTMTRSTSTGSKLDGLEVDDNRLPPITGLRVTDAHIAGLEPTVRANITKQQHTLRTVPLDRRITVSVDNRMIAIHLDRAGVITYPSLTLEQTRGLLQIKSTIPEAIMAIVQAIDHAPVGIIRG